MRRDAPKFAQLVIYQKYPIDWLSVENILGRKYFLEHCRIKVWNRRHKNLVSSVQPDGPSISEKSHLHLLFLTRSTEIQQAGSPDVERCIKITFTNMFFKLRTSQVDGVPLSLLSFCQPEGNDLTPPLRLHF